MKSKKPIIAISCDVNNINRIELRQEYTQAIGIAGGIPAIVPPFTDRLLIDEWLNSIKPNGILLTGGCDIDPEIYGSKPMPYNGRVSKQRDKYELHLLESAIEKKIPVLGICRGIQVINVFFGGTLIQDMEEEMGLAKEAHDQTENTNTGTHQIRVKPNTITYTLLYKEEIMTNSHHHQCIKELGEGLEITAESNDGIIEAVENAPKKILGVQFHPERMKEFGEFFTKWIEMLKK